MLKAGSAPVPLALPGSTILIHWSIMNDHPVHGDAARRPVSRMANGDNVVADGITGDKPRRRFLLPFFIIVTCYIAYAALYIHRTSFVIEGERYYCLFDDAMISMRYARNLAEGNGLVWNAGGERVEGFTNPLWVVMMAGVHFLPLPPSKMSLPVQVIGVLLLIANAWYVLRLAREVTGDDRRVTMLAPVLTLSYLPINHWGIQGMETSLLVLLMTACAYHVIVAQRSRKFTAVPYVLLGFGMLVRMDMLVPLLATGLFLWYADRGACVRHIVISGIIAMGALSVQTAFRWWYFDAILPNTYYLKVDGIAPYLRISRGLYVLARFALGMNPFIFLTPFFLPVIYRGHAVRILVVLFLAQIAYSIYVGGDAWEWWGGSNRYIVIAMPCFFVALSVVVVRVRDALLRVAAESVPMPARLRKLAFGLPVVLIVVTVNSIHGTAALGELALMTPPLHVPDNRRNVELARQLRRTTLMTTKVAVCGAGTLPYFLDRHMIDILGKCDTYIAHQKSHVAQGLKQFTDYLPGHRKWDYHYSIGRLKPDIVMQIWDDSTDAFSVLRPEYAVADYSGYRFYVRRSSAAIRWDVLQGLLSAPLAPVP